MIGLLVHDPRFLTASIPFPKLLMGEERPFLARDAAATTLAHLNPLRALLLAGASLWLPAVMRILFDAPSSFTETPTAGPSTDPKKALLGLSSSCCSSQFSGLSTPPPPDFHGG